MNRPIVSVIIPAYNAQEYLAECLESIINQSIKEIEIICINDASSDDTHEIFATYAQNDDRIIIIDNKVNKGQGECRNIGLGRATGDFIYFLDADDYLISPDALKVLFNEASSKKTDMVCFNSRSKVEIVNLSKRYSFSPHRKGKYDGLMGGIESYIKFRDNEDYFSPTWLYFYSSEFLKKKKLRFISKIASEDISFSFEAHLAANRVSVLKDVLHCYRIRDNSQTHSSNRIYKVKSAETNVRHLISIMNAEVVKDGIENAYGLELNLECGLWRSRFLECNYEEKRSYLISIKKGILADLFYNRVLYRNNFVTPESLNDSLRAGSVWLYGAGLYGREYYRFLREIGVEIDGVLVSSYDGSKLYGYDPVEMEKWKTPDNAIVIPAVSQKWKNEVQNVLSKYRNLTVFDLEEYRAFPFAVV